MIFIFYSKICRHYACYKPTMEVLDSMHLNLTQNFLCTELPSDAKHPKIKQGQEF